MKHIIDSIRGSIQSVLPIAAIVLMLSISVASLDVGILVLFVFGTILLIAGISFFTIGSEISMEPLGEAIGKRIHKIKRIGIPIVICFILGALITIAEPDLQVLAEQVPSISNSVLISCVAAGVGVFLVISLIRTRRGIQLQKLLLIFYTIIVGLAFFVPTEFVPTAFDSGGVTTGPITVPFIMALGAGMATVNYEKRTSENSFGLISLCSIGPIISVLILSVCYNPTPETTVSIIPTVESTKEAFMYFFKAIPVYGKEMLLAILPIIVIFAIFQIVFRRFNRHQLAKICVGLLYTYVGLVLFLTGANIGFMPAGRRIGATIAGSTYSWLLVPIGMIMGYFVVSAEPAVHSLKKQVSEVTNGAVSQKSVGYALSIAVAISIGISMLRVLTGISILPFLIVGYVISILISFFVPPVYTGIAFDSGGVASGPMATTFMLPFAVGACETLGGNIMTDAFGIVAMIATTPLITVQLLGLSGNIRRKRMLEKAHNEFSQIEDDIVYFDMEDCA